jgi:hypothetical protein
VNNNIFPRTVKYELCSANILSHIIVIAEEISITKKSTNFANAVRGYICILNVVCHTLCQKDELREFVNWEYGEETLCNL